MKKSLFFGAIASMMLLATSCQEELPVVEQGGEAVVTFNLTTPQLATRAYSVGEQINTLHYAIYDNEYNLITDLSETDAEGLKDFNGSTTLKLQLTNGSTYTMVFWASHLGENNATPYTVDWTNRTLEVDYEGAECNDDTRDAFFACKTFTVNGTQPVDVTLTRPFAQLNIGTNDLEESATAKYTVTHTAVVAKAYTQFNLVDGALMGEPTDVTFALNEIPANEAFPVDNYDYMAMNYLLVGTTEYLIPKVTLQYSNDGTNTRKREFGQVPVRRNYRTNIYGSLLTNGVDVNVKIEDGFAGENNSEGGDDYEITSVKIGEKYYKTIQAAVNAAQDGDVIEIAANEYKEIVDVTGGKNITLQGDGEGVVIAGIGHESNGTPSTVVIKNLTLNNSLSEANNWFTGTGPCAPCVGAWGGDFVFENCKFVVAGTKGKETGVMTWWIVKQMNFTFDNCVFEGENDHASARAMQIYGNANMTVNNCTFNTYKDYSLKYVAGEGNVAKFNNNTVNNTVNFVELGSSAYPGKNYSIEINNSTYGKNVAPYVVANEEGQTVFINGEQVYPVVVAFIGTTGYATLEAAFDAAQNGDEIKVKAGEYDIDNATNKQLTITGLEEGVVFKIVGTGAGEGDGQIDYGFDSSTITFNYITFKTNNRTYAGYARLTATYNECLFENCYCLNGNSTFNGCLFNVSGDQYNLWTWGAKEMTFDDCVFNSDGKALLFYQEGTNTVNLKVSNCVFNDEGGLDVLKAAIEIGDAPYGATPTYNLTVSGTTVNGYAINDVGINTNSTLWANKNSMPKERLNVVVDNEDVY